MRCTNLRFKLLPTSSYFERSGSISQVPPTAQHVSPTNTAVNISSYHSELAAPAVAGCNSPDDANQPVYSLLAHLMGLLSCLYPKLMGLFACVLTTVL
jgi:hypothetical protein